MTDSRLERILAIVLITGVVLSAALIALGFVASFLVGWDGFLVGGLTSRAIGEVGILLLVATPVFRVVVSAVGFAVERDRLYVGLSLVVLALLVISLALLR
jgi:uncharacterized membrane protein